MRKITIILSIFTLIASACGGESPNQKQAVIQSESTVMPDTVNLAGLQEKEGSFFWNGKLYTGVVIREWNEEEWDTPGLVYEMKDGVYHGKYMNHGPGWHITGNYNENRPDGKWEIYDHTESEIQYFIDGKKHGVWEFYSDGDLVKKQTYENDVLVNEQIIEQTEIDESNIPINIALTFINSYVANCHKMKESIGIIEWVNSNNLTTNRFKNEVKVMIEEAFKIEPEIGLGFDPILDAQDYPDEGFELESFDSETNFIVVKGKNWADFKLTIKVVLEDNKWLVDGCGIVNIPNDKRSERY